MILALIFATFSFAKLPPEYATPDFPVGFIERTNIDGLYHAPVYLGESFTLPHATLTKDHWLAIRYYLTNEKEAFVNSRVDEDVTIVIQERNGEYHGTEK